ncbi:MAG: PBP1A family penicillin-binding protein [Patescibacteria group bacterium]|nr:PBP1A family penicillin-binding protein [Patescibacteria group bacterium]
MKIYSFKTKDRPTPKPVVRSRNTGKSKLPFRWNWRKTLTWLFRLAALGVLGIAILFLYYAKDLPDPNRLMDRNVAESTKIFARDGQLLYEIHGEIKRTQVNLDQITDNLKHATIAVEDKDFYKHGGISITGIMRSVVVDVLSGRKAQGGSTITQQLVKNAILTNNKSWDRKIRELILAVAIDSRFTKDQVLQMYLNEIPYGRNAYGVEAASRSYFNKSAKDLDLAESAYLAAMPQAPTYYNPFGPNRQALDNRKNTILSLMRDQGYITKDQETQARQEEVVFLNVTTGIQAPHFSMMVQDYLAKKYGEKTLEEGGLKVYTTLDLNLQKIAEDAVKQGAEANAKKYNAYNAALVAEDPKTGQILAMVGSKDYFGDPEPKNCTPGRDCLFEPNYNVAIAPRQPGSSFKPYAYVTAFGPDYKYAPATMLMDVETNFGKFGDKEYKPQDYDGKQRGPVSMRQALAGSLNIPAVKTLSLVGVDNVVQTARSLGITSPMADCGLSLVLGGCEVKLIDHVSAYATLANGGVKNEKAFILKIEDKDGNTLEEYQQHSQPILNPEAVYLLTNVMSDNAARTYVFGPNSPLTLPDRPVAAKTGTTQNWHDGWTMGFTPSLVAGVWAGNNPGAGTPNTDMKKGADGVLVAAPIWNRFMKEALKGKPAEEFKAPDGIQQITVDAVSGKLPTGLTPSTKVETFASYNAPTQYDDVHISLPYDSTTDQPATQDTPKDKIIYKNFTVFHSERPDNPDWENPVIAWAQAQGYVYPSNTITYNPQNNNGTPGGPPSVDIVEPTDGQTISSLPLRVVVSASSENQLSKVTISVDGQEAATLTASPYILDINKKYSDGTHILAVRATDVYNKTADTSINVKFALNEPITITEPSGSSLILFPVSLKAESAENYDAVNFYYQNTKGGTPKPIGQAQNLGNFSGRYQYTIDWTKSPGSGEYSVFARTSTGLTTPKIKVSVP